MGSSDFQMYELIKGTGSGMLYILQESNSFLYVFQNRLWRNCIYCRYSAFQPSVYTVQESLTCIAESMKEKDICYNHSNLLVFVMRESKNREISMKQGEPAMQSAAR